MSVYRHEGITILEAQSSRLYIRSFLIDDSINANGWGVSRDAIARSIRTAIGKPFIIDFERFGHPSASTPEELLRVQERYRVGTIIDVGYSDGRAWFIAEIDDARAIKAIQDGLVRFVSPSIIVDEQDIRVDPNGNEIAERFIVAHVAGVRDPAFGVVKAQIRGICSGPKDVCMRSLRLVNASAGERSCMSECLHEKKIRGLEIDDQAIAICLNECRDGGRDGGRDDTHSSSLCSSKTDVNPMHAQNASDINTGSTDKIIAEYERIIDELRDRLRMAEAKPIIKRIIDAKLRLGRIRESDIDGEMARYASSCTDLLEELASVYEELSSVSSRSAVAMRRGGSSTNSSIAFSANRSIAIASPSSDTALYADSLLMMV